MHAICDRPVLIIQIFYFTMKVVNKNKQVHMFNLTIYKAYIYIYIYIHTHIYIYIYIYIYRYISKAMANCSRQV